MTPFHILTLVALLASAWTLTSGHAMWLVAILLAYATVGGLGVAFPQLRFFGDFICRGPGSRRCVALTFDDGPDSRATPALLEVLKQAGVTATFFCVGQRVGAERELCARIVREGHLLGNHSFAHSNLMNFFGPGHLRSEMNRTQAAIREATGVEAQFFRPPMGLSNPLVFRAARKLGLKVIGWSVRSLDTLTPEPERVVERILRKLRPGAIILLHDGNMPAERLVLTIRLLLAKLRERGYEVVRLDKLLE
jgi:peptidoglycan/xylan/chitin deacetylase (PgdA/CDA1 family)